MRLRLSCTFFSTTPFSHAGDVAEVSVKQAVRTHDGKAGVDDSALALFDIVYGSFHIVINAPTRHAAERAEGVGVGVKQHLVTLAGICHQSEGSAGAQLHMRDLHAVINAARHQAFFAPVELECFAQVELERNKRFDAFARVRTPSANEARPVRRPCLGRRVSALRACSNSCVKAASLPNFLARMYFGTATSSGVANHFCRVLRDSPGALCYCAHRHIVAHMHAPFLA